MGGSPRDQRATPWQSFPQVVQPIIAARVIGIVSFGFTLVTAGNDNTLPLEVFGMTTIAMTPVLYALRTLTTPCSFAVILCSVIIVGRWPPDGRSNRRSTCPT
jgi:putative spermidine/putrescine transport system permease protein